jgi:hypothetical protein
MQATRTRRPKLAKKSALASGFEPATFGSGLARIVAPGASFRAPFGALHGAKPVDEIRSKLDSVRSGYLRAGVIIGFVWWLMWIPVVVAIGFDDVVIYRNSLVPSFVIGIVGLIVSLWLYWRVLRSGNPSSELWRRRLSGESIAAAYLALEEIENAQIR